MKMDYLDELVEELKKFKLQNNVLARLCILAYNIGDVVKSVYYSIHYGEGLNDPAYRGEIKCALADAYTQLLVLIRFLGFSEEEIKELGFVRLREFLESRIRR